MGRAPLENGQATGGVGQTPLEDGQAARLEGGLKARLEASDNGSTPLEDWPTAGSGGQTTLKPPLSSASETETGELSTHLETG